MECRDNRALQVGVEVNEKVTTGDKVDPGEGWITDEVMRRERAKFAHFLGHHIAAVVAWQKEP